MKKLFLMLLMTGSILYAKAQSENPKYDKVLADSLGGDDYGMRSYILVILKTGPTKIEDKKTSDSLFKGHIENIGRLASIGKLIIDGMGRQQYQLTCPIMKK